MPSNETTAKFLGYAGLIPFITFSAASWLALPFLSTALAIEILIAYAATIFAFMGAIHWGAAMANDDAQRQQYYIASIVPALIAWMALLIAELPALLLLITGYVALYLYDKAVEKALRLPAWYIPMRMILTLVVVICLTAALLVLI